MESTVYNSDITYYWRPLAAEHDMEDSEDD